MNTAWLGPDLDQMAAAFMVAFGPKTLWLYCQFCRKWDHFIIVKGWFGCPTCGFQKVLIAERDRP